MKIKVTLLLFCSFVIGAFFFSFVFPQVICADEMPSVTTFEEFLEKLNTPDKIIIYMEKNFSFGLHKGCVAYEPEMFFRIRSGDGKDFNTFFSYVLSKQGYKTDLVVFSWIGDDGSTRGFSCSFYKDKDNDFYWYQSKTSIFGPVTSFEEMIQRVEESQKGGRIEHYWILPAGSTDQCGTGPKNIIDAGSNNYSKFEDALNGLDTPEKIFSYMRNNFEFKYHDGSIAYTPEELFRKKKGDCKDFSVFFSSILEKHGFFVEIVGFTFYQKDNKRQGHIVAIYKEEDGQLWYQSNFDRFGPVTSVKDLLNKEVKRLKIVRMGSYKVFPAGTTDVRRPD
jgi:hypothetical protein